MLLWYRIEKVLGQGGFGITYLAHDTKIDQAVAIKEYLPIELAVREADDSIHPVADDRVELFTWGLTRFLDEAKTLAKFRHPNIVRVLFYTEANNTGYMVMEYEHGQSLESILRRGESFDQQRLLDIVLPLADGLQVVHDAGFIHRDIKPANIYIRENGSPVLLDFGSARQSFAGQTHTLTTLVSPGYAPFEQYNMTSGNQGPWTDIYSLGATMYRIVTGRSPCDAIARSAGLQNGPDPLQPASQAAAAGFSADTVAAIDQALAFHEKDRPQSIAQWQALLGSGAHIDRYAATVVAPPPAPTPVPANREQEKGRQGRWLLAGLAAVLVAAVLVAGVAKKRRSAASGANGGEVTQPAPEVAQDQASGHETSSPQAAGDDPHDRRPDFADQDERNAHLLRLADYDIDKMRLSQPADDNALKHLREVLEADSHNRDALERLGMIIRKYQAMAEHAIDNKQYQRALEFINRAAHIAQSDLPGARESGGRHGRFQQQVENARDRLKRAIRQQRQNK